MYKILFTNNKTGREKPSRIFQFTSPYPMPFSLFNLPQMKKIVIKHLVLSVIILSSEITLSQNPIDPGDPPNNKDIPGFYKSRLSDIKAEIKGLKTGKAEVIASTPGGLPVYAVYYGQKDDFQSQANYNSAVGAGNAAYYAKKDSCTKPVVYFVGPVHGSEGEGIAGLVNLIHISETGKDYRGRAWPELKKYVDQCRVIIIPSGNPDGRKRCPYDSFVNLPCEMMTKYAQGTRKDGTWWKHPRCKGLHPMKGDVGMLGAYFNDNGINIMHDEFFSPMAEETKAILKIARDEAPDITVSLHSCCCLVPSMLQNYHTPLFMKKRVAELASQLNQRYRSLNMPHSKEGWTLSIEDDDPAFPPKRSFNLVSALHHLSGTMSFTFECSHGSLIEGNDESMVKYNRILDIQLILYQEMFNYIVNNRLYWN